MDERFEIRELLGEGGAARVYRAWDRRDSREVALKIPHAGAMPEGEARERFLREAAAAGSLFHPHVVRTREVVDLPQGPALALDLVEGESLRDRLDRLGPLPIPEAVSVLGQVLSALEYAHGRGVLHRDLSPRNILVDRSGHARVTDFGLARLDPERTLTRHPPMVGSAAYFAPEQAAGTWVGPQADLYSVGVLGFEMLAGRPPFTGDNPVQVALKHLNQPPPSLRALRPEVPPALEAVLARALAKDPADRFRSAAEMEQALRQASGLERTLLRPAPPPVLTRRPPVPVEPARRFSMVPVVLLLLLLVGGVVLWVVVAGNRDSARQPEVEHTSMVRRRIPPPAPDEPDRPLPVPEGAGPAPMEVLEPAPDGQATVPSPGTPEASPETSTPGDAASSQDSLGEASPPQPAADQETPAPEVSAPDQGSGGPEVAAPDQGSGGPEVAAPDQGSGGPEVAAPPPDAQADLPPQEPEWTPEPVPPDATYPAPSPPAVEGPGWEIFTPTVPRGPR